MNERLIDIFKEQKLFNNDTLDIIKTISSLIRDLLAKKETIKLSEDINSANDLLHIASKPSLLLSEYDDIVYFVFNGWDKAPLDAVQRDYQQLFEGVLHLFFVRFDKALIKKHPELSDVFQWLQVNYPTEVKDVIPTNLYSAYRMIARICHPCEICKYDPSSWETRYGFCDHKRVF